MASPLVEVGWYGEWQRRRTRNQESNRSCCGIMNPKQRREVAMALLASEPVTVLSEQREVLEQLVRTHSTPQQLAVRARIMLFAADGVGVRESAQRLEVWPRTVRRWRKRWRQAADGASVPERLADAPRPGAPETYTPEQICAIVAMTCEKPAASDRPISPLEPTRDCRRSDATRPGATRLAALSGAFFKKEADLKPHR